jgi:hypothetical protein
MGLIAASKASPTLLPPMLSAIFRRTRFLGSFSQSNFLSFHFLYFLVENVFLELELRLICFIT